MTTHTSLSAANAYMLSYRKVALPRNALVRRGSGAAASAAASAAVDGPGRKFEGDAERDGAPGCGLSALMASSSIGAGASQSRAGPYVPPGPSLPSVDEIPDYIKCVSIPLPLRPPVFCNFPNPPFSQSILLSPF